ncbi:Spo0E family sporulation regulatory protein-aspartic acid phosphatase [Brevibacillus sp. B_LB10_24]|uniref:Spo0E family sporulation regulatory protein-aspartic acid phosphatase n=1 Tax=Brevibacillus sp. B_LB10_24 TaxID=3380645 RepID=UPI0038B87555
MILTQTIEDLRERMMILAMETGSLTNTSVVAISQELDKYIVQMQLIREKELVN